MRNYDLKNRTYKFGLDVILCCKQIKIDIYNKPIIVQLIRSSTSVGANYCEAINSSSKKDMRNKFFICKKEIEESRYWLKLLFDIHIEKRAVFRELHIEAFELLKIFQKSINTLNKSL